MIAALLFAGGCASYPVGWVLEVHGRVVDADRQGVGGAEVSLTSAGDGARISTAAADGGGWWAMPVFFEEEGSFPVVISAAASGYAEGLTWAELVLRADEQGDPSPLRLGPGQVAAMGEQRLPPVVLVEQGTGSAGGLVRDAVTGEPLPRARIELRAGFGAPDTEPVADTIASDADGAFGIDGLPAGVYTAMVSGTAGYADSAFPVTLRPGGAPGQVGAASPPLATGELRATLLWDPAVADLDLHLSGPLAGTDDPWSRYQVYEDDPRHPDKGSAVAEIELVDAGMETGGVYEVRDLLYRASALDAGNASASGSLALAASGATMLLWWRDQSWIEAATPGVEGTIWRGLEADPQAGLVRRLQDYDEGRDPDDVLAF